MKNKRITPAKANMMAMAKNGGLAGFKNGGGVYDGLIKAQDGFAFFNDPIPAETLSAGDIRKQNREDKKGMIPARFRNRGQDGLDAYKKMMANKRSGNGFHPFENLSNIFQKKRGNTQGEGSNVGMKCSKTGCGAMKNR